ncbi:hypothetical protein E2320_021933 [Naja naja]|nr:hypothetical protein E2320_021933 [Naja naja]
MLGIEDHISGNYQDYERLIILFLNKSVYLLSIGVVLSNVDKILGLPDVCSGVERRLELVVGVIDVTLLDEAEAVVIGELDGIMLVSEIAVEDTALSGVGVVVFNIEEVTLLFADAVEGTELIGELAASDVTDSGVVASAEVVVFVELEVIVVSGGEVAGAVVVVSNVEVSGEVVKYFLVVGKLGIMLVSEIAVEDTALSGVGVVVFNIEEVTLLFADAVEGTELIGELAASGRIQVVVFIELEVIVVSGGEVAGAVVVVSNVEVSGEVVKLLDEAEAGVVGELVGIMLVSEIAVEDTALSGVGVVVFDVEEVTLLFADAVEGTELIGELDASGVTDSGVVASGEVVKYFVVIEEVVVFVELEVIVVSGGEVAGAVVVVSNVEVSGEVVKSRVIGELVGIMLVSEIAVEDTALSGVGVVVFDVEEVTLLFADAVEGTELIGELAASGVTDSGVVASGEVVKYCVVVVFIELEVIVVSGGEVAVAVVVVSNVEVCGEVVKLLDEAEAGVVGELVGIMLVSEIAVEDTALSGVGVVVFDVEEVTLLFADAVEGTELIGELAASGVTDSGVVASGEVVKYFVVVVFVELEVIVVSGGEVAGAVVVVSNVEVSGEVVKLVEEAEAGVIGELVGFMLVSEIAVEETALSGVGVVVFDIEEVTLLFADAVEGTELIGELAASGVTDSGVVASGEVVKYFVVVVFIELEVIFVSGANVVVCDVVDAVKVVAGNATPMLSGIVLVVSIGGEVTMLLFDEAEAVVIGKLDSVMVVFEKAVENTGLSAEMATSDVIDSGVVTSGEVVKYFVVIVFIELEVIVVSGGEVAVAVVVVSNVEVCGEVVKLLDEAEAGVIRELVSFMLVSEIAVEETALSGVGVVVFDIEEVTLLFADAVEGTELIGELAASDVTDSGVVASAEVVVFIELEVIFVSGANVVVCDVVDAVKVVAGNATPMLSGIVLVVSIGGEVTMLLFDEAEAVVIGELDGVMLVFEKAVENTGLSAEVATSDVIDSGVVTSGEVVKYFVVAVFIELEVIVVSEEELEGFVIPVPEVDVCTGVERSLELVVGVLDVRLLEETEAVVIGELVGFMLVSEIAVEETALSRVGVMVFDIEEVTLLFPDAVEGTELIGELAASDVTDSGVVASGEVVVFVELEVIVVSGGEVAGAVVVVSNVEVSGEVVKLLEEAEAVVIGELVGFMLVSEIAVEETALSRVGVMVFDIEEVTLLFPDAVEGTELIGELAASDVTDSGVVASGEVVVFVELEVIVVSGGEVAGAVVVVSNVEVSGEVVKLVEEAEAVVIGELVGFMLVSEIAVEDTALSGVGVVVFDIEEVTLLFADAVEGTELIGEVATSDVTDSGVVASAEVVVFVELEVIVVSGGEVAVAVVVVSNVEVCGEVVKLLEEAEAVVIGELVGFMLVSEIAVEDSGVGVVVFDIEEVTLLFADAVEGTELIGELDASGVMDSVVVASGEVVKYFVVVVFIELEVIFVSGANVVVCDVVDAVKVVAGNATPMLSGIVLVVSIGGEVTMLLFDEAEAVVIGELDEVVVFTELEVIVVFGGEVAVAVVVVSNMEVCGAVVKLLEETEAVVIGELVGFMLVSEIAVEETALSRVGVMVFDIEEVTLLFPDAVEGTELIGELAASDVTDSGVVASGEVVVFVELEVIVVSGGEVAVAVVVVSNVEVCGEVVKYSLVIGNYLKAEAGVIGELVGIMLVSEIAVEDTALSGVGVVVFDIEEVTLLFADAVEGAELIGELDASGVTDSEVVVFTELEVIVVFGGEVAVAVVVVSNMEVCGAVVKLLEETEAVVIGELVGFMLVSEIAVEETALSRVGVMVFDIEEVTLLFPDAVEGTELIGELAASDVTDSGVVASGEVVVFTELEVIVVFGGEVPVAVVVVSNMEVCGEELSGEELEGFVVSWADVVICDVVDAVMVVVRNAVETAMLSGMVLLVSIGGEVTMLLFDEAKAVVIGKLDGVMLVSEKALEDTLLSGELAASDVTDSGVVASGEVVKYFVMIECGVVVSEEVIVFIELEVIVVSGGEMAVAVVVVSNMEICGEVVKYSLVVGSGVVVFVVLLLIEELSGEELEGFVVSGPEVDVCSGVERRLELVVGVLNVRLLEETEAVVIGELVGFMLVSEIAVEETALSRVGVMVFDIEEVTLLFPDAVEGTELIGELAASDVTDSGVVASGEVVVFVELEVIVVSGGEVAGAVVVVSNVEVSGEVVKLLDEAAAGVIGELVGIMLVSEIAVEDTALSGVGVVVFDIEEVTLLFADAVEGAELIGELDASGVTDSEVVVFTELEVIVVFGGEVAVAVVVVSNMEVCGAVVKLLEETEAVVIGELVGFMLVSEIAVEETALSRVGVMVFDIEEVTLLFPDAVEGTELIGELAASDVTDSGVVASGEVVVFVELEVIVVSGGEVAVAVVVVSNVEVCGEVVKLLDEAAAGVIGELVGIMLVSEIAVEDTALSGVGVVVFDIEEVTLLFADAVEGAELIGELDASGVTDSEVVVFTELEVIVVFGGEVAVAVVVVSNMEVCGAVVKLLEETEAVVIGELVGFMLVSEIAVEETALSRVGVMVFDIEEVTLLFPDAVEGTELIGELAASDVTDSGVVASGEVVVFIELEVIVVSGGEVAVAVVVVSNVEVCGEVVKLLDEAEAGVVGELVGIMLVSEIAVEDTALSGVGVVVFDVEEVTLLFADAVEGTELIGELAASDVTDSGVVASGEVVVFVELEVIVVSGGEVAVAVVVVSNVEVCGEVVKLLDEAEAGVIGELVGIMLVSEIAVEDTALSGVGVVVFDIEEVTLLFADAVEGAELIGEVATSDVTDSGVVASAEVVVFVELEVIVVSGGEVAVAVVVVSNVEVCGEVVKLLDEAEAGVVGELVGIMLVSEIAVEDTALSGVGVVVFDVEEVTLLFADAVEGTELIGELAASDVTDSGVVASGEVVVFIELEVIFVSGANVVVCDVVDAVKVVAGNATPMLSGIVLVVSIGGEVTMLLFDEAEAVVIGELDGVMLVFEKAVENTGLSAEVATSDVIDSGVVTSGEVVKYFVVAVFIELEVIVVSGEELEGFVIPVPEVDVCTGVERSLELVVGVLDVRLLEETEAVVIGELVGFMLVSEIAVEETALSRVGVMVFDIEEVTLLFPDAVEGTELIGELAASDVTDSGVVASGEVVVFVELEVIVVSGGEVAVAVVVVSNVEVCGEEVSGEELKGFVVSGPAVDVCTGVERRLELVVGVIDVRLLDEAEAGVIGELVGIMLVSEIAVEDTALSGVGVVVFDIEEVTLLFANAVEGAELIGELDASGVTDSGVVASGEVVKYFVVVVFVELEVIVVSGGEVAVAVVVVSNVEVCGEEVSGKELKGFVVSGPAVDVCTGVERRLELVVGVIDVRLLDEAEAGVIGELVGIMLVSEIAVEDTALSGVDVVVFDIEEVTLLSADAVEGAELIGELDASDVTDSGVVASAEVVVFVELEVIVVSGGEVAVAVVVVSNVEVCGEEVSGEELKGFVVSGPAVDVCTGVERRLELVVEVIDVRLLDEAAAGVIGELVGIMLVSEIAVEDSGVGVVVFDIEEVTLLFADAVEGSELIGEVATSDVTDSGVVASAEVIKYFVVVVFTELEVIVVFGGEVPVAVVVVSNMEVCGEELSGEELEGFVVSWADVVICDVVDAVMVVVRNAVETAMLSGMVLLVSIGGEVTMLLFDEAKAVVIGKLDGVMLVSEKALEDTLLSGELAASDVTDSGVVASGEVVKYFVMIECGVVVSEEVIVFIELEVIVVSGGEMAVAVVVVSNMEICGEVVKYSLVVGSGVVVFVVLLLIVVLSGEELEGFVVSWADLVVCDVVDAVKVVSGNAVEAAMLSGMVLVVSIVGEVIMLLFPEASVLSVGAVAVSDVVDSSMVVSGIGVEYLILIGVEADVAFAVMISEVLIAFVELTTENTDVEFCSPQ